MSGFSNILQLSSKELNFLNTNNITRVVREFKPKYVINTSAYTNVKEAEKNFEVANEINCNAVQVLAETCKKHNSVLIHYSTDYVFDGEKVTRYNTSDLPNPKNFYGQSKLNGEKKIIESGCDFFIFRISWLVSEYGNNFIKTILSKLRKETNLFIVNDQIGSPISSNLVTEITTKVILDNIKTKKIFHLSTHGKVSWYDIAIYISKIAKNINKNLKLIPIKSHEYTSEIFRPKNSLFDLSEIEKILKKQMPFWQDDIKPIITKLDFNS